MFLKGLTFVKGDTKASGKDRKRNQCLHVFQKGCLPEKFNSMFLTNSQLPSKNTRKTTFRLPYCRTNITKFSIRFQSPKLYNFFLLYS